MRWPVLHTLWLLLAVTGAPALAIETQDCLIRPSREIALSAPSQGLLERVLVDRNDRVRAGELVAELHADLERANLALARLRASDDSAIRTAEIWLDYERQLLERANTLSDRAVVSEQALAERRANFDIRQSELAQARLAQEEAALALAQAEARLAVRQVRSPIDGVVVERLLDAGEFLREDTPLLRLVALDPLHVELLLPQAVHAQISPGMRALIVPETMPGNGQEAVVEKVDPLIDAASGVFGVRLRLDNPGGGIIAGVRCTAQFVM